MSERILCAAIYVDTHVKNSAEAWRGYAYPETGIVFCGWRHGQCFIPLLAWAEKLTPEEREFIGEAPLHGEHQGFLTSKGRFVDREEGLALAIAADQVVEGKTYNTRWLSSEDLY